MTGPFGRSSRRQGEAVGGDDLSTRLGEDNPVADLFPDGFEEALGEDDGQVFPPASENGQPEGQVEFQDTTAAMSLEELALVCRERVCPTCPVSQEAEDVRLRALAELDNTKKRLIREKEEHARFAGEAVLSDILPALDNLDLALQHAPQSEEGKNFVIGVDMTRKLLKDALRRHGLEEVGTVGEAFDPARHEAVGMDIVPEVPENHVCSLLSKGYILNGRLLRPAKVVVCRSGS